MASKKKEPNAHDLTALSESWDTAVKANRAKNEFVAKHRTLVLEMQSLEKSLDRAIEKVKACAHPLATPGETNEIIDDKFGTVSVTGPMGAPEYDAGVARQAWAKEILDKVLIVDKKMVEACVKLGDLHPDSAKKAELPRQPKPPSAKVVFK